MKFKNTVLLGIAGALLTHISSLQATEELIIDRKASIELSAKTVGSLETPVKLDARKIDSLEDILKEQQKYYSSHYADYQWVGVCTSKTPQGFIQQLTLTKDGKLLSLYFDVSSCFKKLKAKSKKLNLLLKKLEQDITIPKDND